MTSRMDQRRLIASYVLAVIVPPFVGFWLNGIGHFAIGRYKRGLLFVLGTLVFEFVIAFLFVAWPLTDGGYAPPWAEVEPDGLVHVESLLPGILLTWAAGFVIWIVQIIDLSRLNKALTNGEEKLS